MGNGESIKEQVWNKTGGKCWYCGKQCHWATKEDTQDSHYATVDWFTIDHVIPRCLGGTSELKNLLPACMSCNTQKRNKTLEEYRVYLQRKNSGIPAFTDEQIEYLSSHGIRLPEPKFVTVTFWGEKAL